MIDCTIEPADATWQIKFKNGHPVMGFSSMAEAAVYANDCGWNILHPKVTIESQLFYTADCMCGHSFGLFIDEDELDKRIIEHRCNIFRVM